jgi:hypothetical protein
MAIKSHLAEAALVDLSDDSLKEFLGHLWEGIKGLEEQRKNDEVFAELVAKANEHNDLLYRMPIKEFKAKLKAARAQAKVRGITWKAPDKM